MHCSRFCQEISHKQDTSLEFYEFQYQMILPHSLLMYLHLSADVCHDTLMDAVVVMPSCVVFVLQAFLCCATVHYKGYQAWLVSFDSLLVGTNLLA